MARYGAVVFDLDDTLVDTTAVRPFRERRQWKKAVEAVSQTRVFDGVMDLLRLLGRHEIPWAVVTTSVSYYAHAVIGHYGLQPRRVVAFHDALPTKPNPKGVLLAVDSPGLPTSEVLGVGNSAADQVAYREAGVLSLAALWSPALEPDGWDGELRDPSDLAGFLDLS